MLISFTGPLVCNDNTALPEMMEFGLISYVESGHGLFLELSATNGGHRRLYFRSNVDAVRFVRAIQEGAKAGLTYLDLGNVIERFNCAPIQSSSFSGLS